MSIYSHKNYCKNQKFENLTFTNDLLGDLTPQQDISLLDFRRQNKSLLYQSVQWDSFDSSSIKVKMRNISLNSHFIV